MAIATQHGRSTTRARPLAPHERFQALAHLAGAPRRNLQLTDLAADLGRPRRPGEVSPQLLGAWRGRELAGVAALRPTVLLDACMQTEVLDAFIPYLASIETGLVKSIECLVTPFWERLQAQGRRRIVDRAETAYALLPSAARLGEPSAGIILRPARDSDLDDLVVAARASLREEGRLDPPDGDPVGLRAWVQGRQQRARVVEVDGRVAFVAYADVRRSEGWLIQGVYTWPELRRRGMAAFGMSALVREAFGCGAQHVQLAVIEGNAAAIGLYERLGFRPFAKLRTILFA